MGTCGLGASGQYISDTFLDMHDGDKKSVRYNENYNYELYMVIQNASPHLSKGVTWKVETSVKDKDCTADVDFNVPHKPNPPPVNLTATLKLAVLPADFDAMLKPVIEFTDPSGKLAAKDYPLNQWVGEAYTAQWPQLNKTWGCHLDGTFVFADMHDGDQKQVVFKDTSVTITPYGNKQSWTVQGTLQQKTCSAVLDFNVAGKPNPPPFNLRAVFQRVYSSGLLHTKDHHYNLNVEFLKVDASRDEALNRWVQIKHTSSGSIV